MLILSPFLRRGHRNSYKTDIISLMQFTDKPSQSVPAKTDMLEEARYVCFILGDVAVLFQASSRMCTFLYFSLKTSVPLFFFPHFFPPLSFPTLILPARIPRQCWPCRNNCLSVCVYRSQLRQD